MNNLIISDISLFEFEVTIELTKDAWLFVSYIIEMEKYIFKEKLGEGSYGVVWRVMR